MIYNGFKDHKIPLGEYKFFFAVWLLCVGGGGWWGKLFGILFFTHAKFQCVCEPNVSTAVWVFPKASFKIKFGVLKIESYLNKIAKQQQQKQQCHSCRHSSNANFDVVVIRYQSLLRTILIAFLRYMIVKYYDMKYRYVWKLNGDNKMIRR